MRLLFSVNNFGFLRNFEPALRALAARGHHLHLLAERADAVGGTRTIEGLQRDFPSQVTWAFAPSRKQDLWQPLALQVRLCLDYWRYLDPQYARAFSLRERAARQSPGFASALPRVPVVGSRPAMRVWRALFRTIERALPPGDTVERILREQNPDVLLLTPLFKTLPEAVLAALIIHALWHIFVARKLLAIRALSHTEFWLGWVAFAGVILYDVLAGMLIGLVASTLLMVYRSSRPHLAVLGRAPGVAGKYQDVERHPESTAVPGVLVFRLDTPLYYANALTVSDRVLELVETADPKPRAIVFDATALDSLDITSAEMLEKLVTKLRADGIELVVAEVHAPVVAFARRTGLLAQLGEGRIYPTVDAAVRALENQNVAPPARP